MKKYYVYRIYHEIENKYYVGSRTISERIDILNGYNTSSKVVKNLIKDYGIDKFKIDYILEFKSAKDAINKENEILQKINDQENYLNVNFSAGGAVIKSQSHFQIYNESSNEYIYHPKNVKIPSGWIKKSSFKPPSRKGYKQLINLKTKETTYLNLLENELPEGWVIKTEYDKEIYNNTEKKTVYITNGIINKKIRKSDKLPTGWRFGNTKKRKSKIIINNYYIEKEIDIHEVIPEGWIKGKLKIKRTYKYKDVEYNTKKELVEILGISVTKFDYDLAKNRIKDLYVYDNNKLIQVKDRYFKEKCSKEKDMRGKFSKYEYIYDGKIFDSKIKLIKFLNITEGRFDYKIKTKKINIERRLKNGYND